MRCDVLGVLPSCSRAAVAEIEKTHRSPHDQLRGVIAKSELLPRIHCLVHPLGVCPLTSTDVEVACPVCVENSAGPDNGLGKNGPQAKRLLTWARMMRTVQPRLILNECTNQLDDDMLPTLLGDMYHLDRCEVSPSNIGLVSLDIPLVFTIMVHKQKGEVTGDMRHVWEAPTRLALVCWVIYMCIYMYTDTYIYNAVAQIHNLYRMCIYIYMLGPTRRNNVKLGHLRTLPHIYTQAQAHF